MSASPPPSEVSTPTPVQTGATSRLLSLDALRGFDMFWILGGDALMQALRHMNTSAPVQILANQLEHKDWDGFAFYDLIFPLFVFIVGVSLVFSLTKTIQQHGRSAAVKRILVRGALLFLLGIFYNGGLSNLWPNVRIVGVLQRIAIAYVITGLLFCYFKPRVLAGICVAILAGYWAAMTFVPIRDIKLDRKVMRERYAAESQSQDQTAENNAKSRDKKGPSLEVVHGYYQATNSYVTGRYEPGLNLSNHLDFQYLPGSKYDGYWDPEGLLSSLPAVATCLLGVFGAFLLRRSDLGETQKVMWLIGSGVVALTLGYVWGFQFPVNKKLWTSTFVLVAGGWSLVLLGIFYFVVDVLKWQRWCQPFVWIGMNPITLYIASSFINIDNVAKRFVGGNVGQFFDNTVTKGFGEFVIVIAGLALTIAFARLLYVKKVFLRV